jgi:uncharacterized protein (TIRG00374 family)
MRKDYVSYFVAFVLTAALLYFAFRGLDLNAGLQAISSARVLPLIAGLLIMLLSHAVRAYRWQILLRPLKQKTSFARAFRATIAGYGANNLSPRSGEILRPFMMSSGEKMPLAGVLASVVVERLADVVALALLIVFSLVAIEDKLFAVFPTLSTFAVPLLVAVIAALAVFVAIFFSERRTLAFVRVINRVLPASFGSKLEKAAADFSRGLRGLDRRAILPLIIGTVGIWVLYGISMYVSLQGFSDMHMAAIDMSGAFVLLTLSGISFTIPTPGATGTYHFFISQGLAQLFGVPLQIGLAYALLTHLLSFTLMTVLGVIFMFRDGLSFASLKRVKAVEEQVSLAAE